MSAGRRCASSMVLHTLCVGVCTDCLPLPPAAQHTCML